MDSRSGARRVGRYVVSEKIAAGGMAAVYLAQLRGPVGFARIVAVKRLHGHFAGDAEFVAMLMDEARLASRIQHPNVVSTLDVVAEDGDLFLVMDYVQGESLAKLVKNADARNEPISHKIAVTVMSEVLLGLHAAHEAKDENGKPLDIVHRDVSPQNVLVGVDGIPRVLDFGIAKASSRSHSTRDGHVKGKAGYMAPEQIEGDAVDRRTDVYAVSVVLWELLAGRRLFTGDNPVRIMKAVLDAQIEPPSKSAGELPAGLDDIVMRGLRSDPKERFANAREMALALEHIIVPARKNEIGEWVEHLAHDALEERRALVAKCESMAETKPSDVAGEDSASSSQVMTLIGEARRTEEKDGGRGEASTKLEGRRRSGRVLLPGFLAAGLVVVVATVFFARYRESRGSARIAASASTMTTTTAAPFATTPSAPLIASPSGVLSAVSSGVISPSAVIVPTSHAHDVPLASHRPRSASSAPHVDCTIPYFVDSDGVRHPRDECAK